MKINRHNYEEYFILYADNELSSEDRRMVEEFASLNPDLKDELDNFCSTVLLPDVSVQFSGKEDLLRYDDSLISYIDDELPADEKAELEKLVAATPSLQKEMELYRKTKLQPEEIVFENKSVLYRHEERKIVRMAWVRWAVAAVILLAVSITAISVFNDINKENPGTAGINTEKGKGKTEALPQNLAVVPKSKNSPSPVNEKKNDENLNTPAPVVNYNKTGLPKEKKYIIDINTDDKKEVMVNNTQKQPSNNLPVPENNSEPDTKRSFASIGAVDGEKNVNDLYTAVSDVTNRKPSSYIQTGGPSVTDEVYPEEEGGDNKKSRGLFRKITRVFEKNTGIKTTTDDDKLHIMAFTVKLK